MHDTHDTHDTSWNKELLTLAIQYTCALIVCSIAWVVFNTRD